MMKCRVSFRTLSFFVSYVELPQSCTRRCSDLAVSISESFRLMHAYLAEYRQRGVQSPFRSQQIIYISCWITLKPLSQTTGASHFEGYRFFCQQQLFRAGDEQRRLPLFLRAETARLSRLRVTRVRPSLPSFFECMISWARAPGPSLGSDNVRFRACRTSL